MHEHIFECALMLQILSGEVEPPPEMNTLYQKLYSRMAVDPTSSHEAEARTATHTWNAAP